MRSNLYHYKAKLVRVIDGDSIVIDIDLGLDTWVLNQSVRLFGVDTPERKDKEAWQKAKQFVLMWLEPFQNDLLIKTHLDRDDKYGRLLVTIYNNDQTTLNNDLIIHGHAHYYYGGKKE